jgi:hypothetical protein
MDLRKFHPTKRQIIEARELLGYQPFIISDDIQTGNGYAFIYGEGLPEVMERNQVSIEQWTKFTEANARMGKMYDDWISQTCAAAGDLSNLSVIDTACNDGYFLYRFWQAGIRKCVGYDREYVEPTINFMNQLLGSKIRFVNEPYNPLTHRIKGCNKYDIVVSSAIVCHLSDPLNYISFLASITRKVLLIHTIVSNENDYVVSYGKPNKYHKKDPFPVCFDNNVTISQGLLLESLHLSGFEKIQEIEYRNEWLPWDWYHWQKTYIAIKGPTIGNPTKIWNTTLRRQQKLRQVIYRLIGYKRYASIISFIKSKPKLRSWIERF